MILPTDLYYTKEHVWLRIDGEMATVGITDHAQAQLGDVVFVDLPQRGTALKKGVTFGTAEAVQAVCALYAPLDGGVLENNDALIQSPELVNADPYGKGWLLRIKLIDLTCQNLLLTAKDYETLLNTP